MPTFPRRLSSGRLGLCLSLVTAFPAVSHAATLSLQQAVQMATETSPQIKAAAALKQAQTERKRGSWSGLGPRVNLQYTDANFNGKQVLPLNPPVVVRDNHVKTGTLQIAQPIVGLYGLIEKANYETAQETSKTLNYDITSRDVIQRTIEIYIRTQAAEQMVAVAQASVSAADKQAKDAEAMQRVGRMNQGDYLKLQVAVSEAKARLAQAEATLEITSAGLREAVGAPGDAKFELDGLKATAKTVSGDTEVTQAVNTALQNNPEIRLAETNKEIAGFGRKLAVTEFLPSVNFFVKYDRDLTDNLPKDLRDTKSYGITASWDIWSNGSSVFAMREAGQQIVAAENGITGTQQKVRLDVIQAASSLKAQAQAVELAETAVNQATEAYRIEKANFDNGRTSATDLVISESTLTGARGRQVTALAEYTIGWYQLQKATGGDIRKP